MRMGMPSRTAARVAAYRLGFDRLQAPYGDPSADVALARDVAEYAGARASESMERYLRARTRFFDRMTVSAIDAGIDQVVAVGAGYDGRSLRYAKEGVRWWEVDHATTQTDKRARVERLGVDVGHVTFVAFDLENPGLAASLVESGFESRTPALFCCEGLTVYLSPNALARLLVELRTLAAPGARLCLSVGPRRAGETRETGETGEAGDVRDARVETGGGGGRSSSRLWSVLRDLGEPAVGVVDREVFSGLLVDSRWRIVETSDRLRRVGFIVASPD